MFRKQKQVQEQVAPPAPNRAPGLWTELRTEFDALAADPASPERRSAVATRYAVLALTPPTHLPLTPPTHLPPGGLSPMGFAVRPDRGLQDCALTERALAALGPLIDGGHDPVHHLQLRAHLLAGWQRFAEAGADLDAAAALVPGDGPEADQARGLLRHHAAMWRGQGAGLQAVPEWELAQLREAVGRVAPSIGRVVAYVPPLVALYGRADVPIQPDPRLLALDAKLVARGMQLLAWVENSTFAELFQQRVITGAWGAPDHSFVVSAGAVGQVEVADVESVCNDGRFVTTVATRGQSGFVGGPWIDTLNVDTALTIDEVIDLHTARLRALFATTPGLAPRPVGTGPAWAAMQEEMRRRKAEFRLAEGLSDSEARGFPLQYPDVAVPMLRAAAREAVATAYAAAAAEAA